MVIWAGIDLLGSFSAPSGARVGLRFKHFVMEYMTDSPAPDGIPPEMLADVLYTGLRNPMVHSFGLNSKYDVILAQGRPDFVLTKYGTDNTYVVIIEGLYAAFIAGVEKYRDKVQTDAAVRAKFFTEFERNGVLGMTTKPAD